MTVWKVEIIRRLASLRLAPTREAEIVEELAQHLEDRYAELLTAGLTEGAAYRAALAELSESETLQRELRQVEEESHQPVVLGERRSNVIADLWQDLGYGARILRKNPGFIFSVAQRTREIGIRIALGAQSREVLRLILTQGLRLVTIGVALGVGGGAAVLRVLRSLLFGLSPLDPVAYVGVSVCLIVVALMATYLPARRAAAVDPMVALRHE